MDMQFNLNDSQDCKGIDVDLPSLEGLLKVDRNS